MCRWRFAGARSYDEFRSYTIAALRRRVGLTAVQAMARHRLDRVPFIGVPRVALRERMDAQRQRRQQGAAPAVGRAAAIDPREFFAYQARAPGFGG